MLLVSLAVSGAAFASDVSLTEPQRRKLIQLVASEPEVKQLFHKLQREADASLSEKGRPVAKLGTAARLSSDPRKIESRASLEDMKRLEALGYTYAVTDKAAYKEAARRIILRWAEINQPNGVPIDETKLEPLFVAYDLVRPGLSAANKKAVDHWLGNMARLELQSGQTNSVTAMNNWNSHRLKIVGLIAFLLDDKSLIDQAVQGFKRQIEANLAADGSSFDFQQRDALHYHCYDLEPLLALAIAARQRGMNLFDWQASNGASLSNSVAFLVPYCDGTRAHAEWVHSKVKFDRQRAEAGEKGFVVGAPFNPREARRVFELAAFFDPRYQPLVSRLVENRSLEFPTWQAVLNRVRRPE